MLAPPIHVNPAFREPDRIWQLIEAGAPYRTLGAVHRDPPSDHAPGWFRNFWALGGRVIFPGAEAAFHNPNFIEAARQSFQSEIIQPLAMMTNFNVPAAASPPHLDLPFFRGAHQREVPSWLLAPMGYSGLFQPWAIPVASAITWFYAGTGGDFEYWPAGVNAPSRIVRQPCTNTCVLADNEYMYHRVGQMGDPQDYLDAGISSEAQLHRSDDGWDIRLNGDLIRHYRQHEVRVSILWKAFCFKDQYQADQYADPAGNLTPSQIVDIFCDDLRRRQVKFQEPADLETDRAWMQVVLDHYRPALALQADNRRTT
ncbi:MAG: hypothetical protein O3B72_00625 [Proteobacteria bacterium]|nr:hypothetical protein [Pseudomonadota bacterium]